MIYDESAWLQMFSRTAALFTGRYRKTARFFQLCGEYAHRCNLNDRLGDEGGSKEVIQKIRVERLSLAPCVHILYTSGSPLQTLLAIMVKS